MGNEDRRVMPVALAWAVIRRLSRRQQPPSAPAAIAPPTWSMHRPPAGDDRPIVVPDVPEAVREGPARPGRGRRVMEVGLKALIVLAVCVYMGVPTLRMAQNAARAGSRPGSVGVARQIEVREPLTDEVRKVSVSTARSGDPLVLTYHDVSDVQGRWTVTPARFASHMAVLAKAGYRTASLTQLAAHLEGRRPLPARSVVIAFDDGARGTWIYADRILRRHGFQAAAFIVTDLVGVSPYYLTWEEIGAMRASGRWDFQDHSHNGHRMVKTHAGADGTEFTPFFTNRVWRAEEGRLETLHEFRARIRTDLERSRAAFAERGLPEPRFFAFPFGAAFGASNDRRAAAIARDEVLRRVRYAFVGNAHPCGRDRSPRSRLLDRFVVMRDTDAQDLVKQLRAPRDIRVDKDSYVDCAGKDAGVRTLKHPVEGPQDHR